MEHKCNSAASGLKECITKRVLYLIFHSLVYITIPDVTLEKDCHKLQTIKVNQRKDRGIPDCFGVLKHCICLAAIFFSLFFSFLSSGSSVTALHLLL